jgi:bifunctional non-homologous end joining protein LigD
MAKSEYTMLEVAGREVRLSNPGKVYFPKPGWTKLDLVEYYLGAADAVLTHLRERPTVMKRFVDGITEDPIWQKRVPKNVPDWLQTTTVAFPSGRTAEELVANDEAHLVWAVNLGVIDFNPHPVRRADLDHPDELRVDLDPTDGVGWPEVRRTAMVVEEVLREHGLRGYPKTSGSKGIHVNVRIAPEWDYVEVRRAALALAREVERRAPGLATSKWWKEERQGVFVDYNQNARDRTVASGYSVRPTPDARVSCALDWEEVPDAEPGDFRLDTVPERLRRHGDPADDIDQHAGSLEALLDLARRDEEGGLGDAPWPPHFPKAKGEPKRVQPSRDKDRPTHRGRAGDPQPGGPPPGVRTGGLQQGFGAKPRTGQGYAHEFEDEDPAPSSDG